jgi:hypothetical protein
MVWLNRTEVQIIPVEFIFNLNIVFTLNFCSAVCALAQDFSHEQDFSERNLLQHASRTLL